MHIIIYRLWRSLLASTTNVHCPIDFVGGGRLDNYSFAMHPICLQITYKRLRRDFFLLSLVVIYCFYMPFEHLYI